MGEEAEVGEVGKVAERARGDNPPSGEATMSDRDGEVGAYGLNSESGSSASASADTLTREME